MFCRNMGLTSLLPSFMFYNLQSSYVETCRRITAKLLPHALVGLLMQLEEFSASIMELRLLIFSRESASVVIANFGLHGLRFFCDDTSSEIFSPGAKIIIRWTKETRCYAYT